MSDQAINKAPKEKYSPFVCSTMVEHHIDPKTVSVYAKCSCGEEIIEFQVYHDWDIDHKDLYKYFLFYHGQLSKRDLNLGCSGLEFLDENCAALFGKTLECCVDSTKSIEPTLFFDNELPDKYLRKYGNGLIEVSQDYTVDLRKWTGSVAYEKHLKHPKRKNTCMWEVCLDAPVALQFAHEIEKILDGVPAQLTNS